MTDEDEIGLPQKGLNMIIKDVLPDLRIANESRELLNQCCVEFVKHVSREAQRISSSDQRKTIYHEHVQKALSNLSFPSDYVQAANSVLDECKIAAEKRLKRKKSRLDKCGIPEEELYLMQQELIEKARREEAEKQMILQQQSENQTFSMAGEPLQSTNIPAALLNNLIVAQNNPTLLSQLLASNTLPPELANAIMMQLSNTASNVEPKEEIQQDPTYSTANDIEQSSCTGSITESKTETTNQSDPSCSASDVKRNVNSQPQLGMVMSNDLRARLVANFVASIESRDVNEEEDYD